MIKLDWKKRFKQLFCRHHWKILDSEWYGYDATSLYEAQHKYCKKCGKEKK